MKDQIRNVIREHGQLSVDPDTLPDDARLCQAGMTSDASVNVMTAIEDTFDVARRGQGPAVSGIVGYRNDTPNSIGRHQRDTMSARLMVANERIHATDVSPLLIVKEV